MTLLAAMQEKRGNCSFVHSIATILNVHVQILTSFLHFLNYLCTFSITFCKKEYILLDRLRKKSERNSLFVFSKMDQSQCCGKLRKSTKSTTNRMSISASVSFSISAKSGGAMTPLAPCWLRP